LAVKLLTRRRHYEDFIYGRTFAQYIKAMKHSEYGDNLTLQVLADAFCIIGNTKNFIWT
jgi:hypothetical protein